MENFAGLMPLRDGVFVEFQSRIEEMRRQYKDLVIPEPKHQGPPDEGYVIAVGSEAEVKVGDYVYYKSENPFGFHWKGKKVIPITQKQILAIRDES